MIIAEEKKRTNIAEYVLYMWQIEDLIRAYDLDLEKVETNIISNYTQPEEVITEIRKWYSDLVKSMKREKKESSGHLQFLEDLVNELNRLHQEMLNDAAQMHYQEVYRKSQPFIVELSSRAKGAFDHEIDACMHGLYGLLLLRLSRKKVSEETLKAFTQIGELMALLAQQYKDKNQK
jgi:hypothetical protein